MFFLLELLFSEDDFVGAVVETFLIPVSSRLSLVAGDDTTVDAGLRKESVEESVESCEVCGLHPVAVRRV